MFDEKYTVHSNQSLDKVLLRYGRHIYLTTEYIYNLGRGENDRNFDFYGSVYFCNWNLARVIIPGLSELFEEISSFIQKEMATRFKIAYFATLLAYTGLMLLLLGFISYITYKIYKKQLFAIESYCFLKDSDLGFMKEIRERSHLIFTKLKYNEVILSSEFSKSRERILAIKLKYKKEGVHLKRFKRDELFPGIRRILLLGVSMFMLSGFLYILFVVYHKNNKSINVLTKFLLDYSKTDSDKGNYYLSLIYYILYADTIKIAGKLPSENYYSTSFLKNMNLVRGKEQEIMGELGELKNDYDFLLKGNFCEKLKKEDNLTQFICQNFNNGMYKRGMISLNYYENQIFSNIYEQRSSHERNRSHIVRGFDFGMANKYFVLDSFMKARLGYTVMSKHYWREIIRIITKRTSELKSILDVFTKYVVIIASSLLLVFLAALLPNTMKKQQEDRQSVLETFKIIHPQVLIENGMLLNIYKRIFYARMVNRV